MSRIRFAKRALLATAILAAYGANAQTPVPAVGPGVAISTPITGEGPSKLTQASGQVTVAVRLADAPLVVAVGANAKRLGTKMTLAQRQSYMADLKGKQDALMGQIQAAGGAEVARTSKAYNALVITIDAAKLPTIAALPGVTAVRPVVDLEKSLLTTVPYIGGSALQTLGVTGAGVKIAVLDSGIDYTHRNLGGSGSATDFALASAAAASTAPAALYPSAKVIGGYDFVGEVWPNGPAVPDSNPIDAGSAAGHGTHVADIAGGASLDGTHKGVAPGAQLYAVKVCSSVSTSCNGVAILQGLDWVTDPRGDLSFEGAADVVNLSLGGGYGQRENPSTEAVSNIVRFGIVAAISAGNSGDRPFILGSPSNAAEAISVAQTQVPTATAMPLIVNAPASIAGTYGNTATVPWAPIVNGFSGDLVTAGSACPGDPLPVLTGKVALIDRATCSISLKVAYAAANGASAVIIANNAAGDAPSFSFGGGAPLVETLVVTQAIGNTLKSAPAGSVKVTVGPSVAIPLAGSMVASSSRGPSYSFSSIKPEIGAPGASMSAEYGTGDGETAFGGTSGAAPMISGSAALLLEKFPQALPPEIKSRLMNSAYQTIYTNPATLPGQLAPITRIGGGEVRVDKAAAVTSGIWDAVNPYSVGLSFGAPRVSATTTISKKVAVRNYSNAARTFAITRSFRYANDAASGAVTLSAPSSITVPANGTGAFVLTMSINPALLPAWNLASPANQGTGALLQDVEFDGYITVADGTDSASTPWHVLPRKSANIAATGSLAMAGAPTALLPLSNLSTPNTGVVDIFALTGTSPQSATALPAYGGGQVVVDLKAVGVRHLAADGAVQFAVTSFGSRAHPAYPAEYNVYVDNNDDGVDDYVIYNGESGAFGTTGQTVTWVQQLGSSTRSANYYVTSDLNSANMILTAPLVAIGLSPGQKFRFSVYAFDNYFTGDLTDAITGMKHTLNAPRYLPAVNAFGLPGGFNGATTTISKPAGGATASPSQTGLLIMYRDGKTGRESDTVIVSP